MIRAIICFIAVFIWHKFTYQPSGPERDNIMTTLLSTAIVGVVALLISDVFIAIMARDKNIQLKNRDAFFVNFITMILLFFALLCVAVLFGGFYRINDAMDWTIFVSLMVAGILFLLVTPLTMIIFNIKSKNK